MEIASQVIFLGALLFVASILASVVTPRLGVPVLLIFLLVALPMLSPNLDVVRWVVEPPVLGLLTLLGLPIS